jgi:hypothetical protein
MQSTSHAFAKTRLCKRCVNVAPLRVHDTFEAVLGHALDQEFAAAGTRPRVLNFVVLVQAKHVQRAVSKIVAYHLDDRFFGMERVFVGSGPFGPRAHLIASLCDALVAQPNLRNVVVRGVYVFESGTVVFEISLVLKHDSEKVCDRPRRRHCRGLC